MIDPKHVIPDDAVNNPAPSISKSGKPFDLRPISPISPIGYNALTLVALTHQRTRAKTITSKSKLATARATPLAAATTLIKAFKGVRTTAGSSSAIPLTSSTTISDKPSEGTPSAIVSQGTTTDETIENIPSASSADPPHGTLQATFSSQMQEITLKQEQDSLNSLFSFAIDVSDDDGEEANSSLALGTISAEIKSKLEALLNLLQQDTAQLVDDSDPTKAIFKTIRGQVPADVEEALFLIADEKHKGISNLQTSGAELKQKILDLSAKRMTLLAELKEVEAALTHAKQEESQLPDAIKALQQERDIQARKALVMKKKLKPVEGVVDEDIKEIKDADQIRLRVISAIQSLLNLKILSIASALYETLMSLHDSSR
uniref:Uncharacterized protein n=1 Tax=Saccharum hybrid cultivar R570 TaxID=131158 RepID=A0A059Q2S2_9POAL|nr:hypothetical protein SHCRBa_026_B05_R_50 [Saccharum hybrid cultivar R570]AGT16331.1 hypothetical protein SHCRBa_026_F17_F_200 [Saccharum hybrid cultivar R570]